MNRYEFNKQQSDIKAYQTSRLPKIQKSYNDRFIFSREGDRLDNLAYDLYGDPRYWVVLANANQLGKGSLIVPAGIQLRLPPQSVIDDFSNMLRSTEESR